MACPEYENRITEMQEGTLPIADRRGVEEHVAACVACRRFLQRLNELDAVMTTVSRTPGPSPDFKARLLRRIDLEAPGLSAEAIEARKRELAFEFAATMAGLQRRVWRAHLPLLLDILGLITMALIAVRILRSITGPLPSLQAIGHLMVKVTTGYLAWAWAMAGVTAGLLWAFGRRSVPWR
jgi:anti-sigma factor RsiW